MESVEKHKRALPNGWALAPFDLIFEVVSDQGKKLKERDYSGSGSLPVIDQGEKSIAGYTSRIDLKYSGTLPIILFGDHTRRFKFVEQSFVIGADGIKLIAPITELDAKFAFWSLRAAKFEDRGYSRHFQFVRKLEFAVPPVSEQRRISAKMDELFGDIEAGEQELERAREGLAAYRRAVLKAAVTGELTRDWREANKPNETGWNVLDQIRDARRTNSAVGSKSDHIEIDETDLPLLPSGWSWASMDQMANVTGGLTKNAKRAANGSQHPYLRVANVQENFLDLNDVRFISVSNSELPRVLLQRGDLLFVEGNGSPDQIGRVALWDASISPCVHQNHLIKARFGEISLAAWALHWFLSPHGKALVRRAASSTSGLHTLSISKIQRLPMPIPPASELAVILGRLGEKLSAYEELVEVLRQVSPESARAKQSVLIAAFSGRLVAQDPGEEPASVLLERLRSARTNGSRESPKLEPARASRRAMKAETPP